MSRFQVNWRCHTPFQGVGPSRNAKTPTVPRLEARKGPLRMRSDEVVTVKNRKVEKVARYFHTNCVHSLIFRTGSTESVPIETG